MTDLIKELSDQAKASVPHGLKVEIWIELYNKKFAELVVRECIKQARSVGDLRGVNDDMIYGADYAALQISKHFGVE